MRTPNEPNIVVMYVIVGVVAVVIFSFVVVVLVIFLLRKKRPNCSSMEAGPSSHQRERGERREQLDTKLLTNQLNLYSGLGGRDTGGCSGPESSGGEGGGGSPDIFDYLPSTRDCYMRGYQPSPSRLSPATLSSVLECGVPAERNGGVPECSSANLECAPPPPREQGDGAEGVLERPEPLYAESTKRTRKQFCPSSLIEAEYCRVSSLRKVAPPTLPKPLPPPLGGGQEVDQVAPPHPYGPPLLNQEEERRVRNCTTV